MAISFDTKSCRVVMTNTQMKVFLNYIKKFHGLKKLRGKEERNDDLLSTLSEKKLKISQISRQMTCCTRESLILLFESLFKSPNYNWIANRLSIFTGTNIVMIFLQVFDMD